MKNENIINFGPGNIDVFWIKWELRMLRKACVHACAQASPSIQDSQILYLANGVGDDNLYLVLQGNFDA